MSRNKKGRPVNGWLVLDKPVGMTSTHAVNMVKRLFDARKAGHAGTLDPLATGILPIGFGEATKTMNFAVDSSKGYRFTVRWGEETTTDDAEGAIVERSDVLPEPEAVAAALSAFIGQVSQVPPKFSAIKVDGHRAYDLAREGEDVTLEARTVEIHDLRIVATPDARHTVLEAECGKGTYVRAIARDLGRRLECFGHVVELRRTKVGPFSLDHAVTIAEIEEMAAQPEDDRPTHLAHSFLRPVSAALTGFEEIQMNQSDAGRLRRGQSVILRGRDAPVLTGFAFATLKGQLVALGEIDQGAFIPTRVFNLAA